MSRLKLENWVIITFVIFVSLVAVATFFAICEFGLWLIGSTLLKGN
jgi:hypothetical protein